MTHPFDRQPAAQPDISAWPRLTGPAAMFRAHQAAGSPAFCRGYSIALRSHARIGIAPFDRRFPGVSMPRWVDRTPRSTCCHVRTITTGDPTHARANDPTPSNPTLPGVGVAYDVRSLRR